LFQGSQIQPQQVANPYIEFIQNLINRIQHNWISQKIKTDFQSWLMEQIFKKFALRGRVTIDANLAAKIENSINFNFLTLMTDWVESLEAEGQSIFNYTLEQAQAASVEWHENGRGSSENYDKLSAENIVYGPQWQDKNGNEIPQYKGWTIQKVVSENDLEVEGDKCDQCVGGYFYKVKNNQSIIYSLRDPRNEPHVTIETDGLGEIAYQIFGKKNSEPKPEYKAMIKVWIESGQNAPQIYGEDEDIIYDVKFSRWGGYREFVQEFEDAIEQKITGKDEYGFKNAPVSINEVEHLFHQAYDAVGELNNQGYYGDRGLSSGLVQLALEGGKYMVEHLFELIQKGEEDIDPYYESGLPYPQEEDYEDIDDYNKAIEDYEREEQDIMDQSFPTGWFADIYKETRQQLEKIYHMTLEDFLKQENPPIKSVAQSRNWYKNIKF